MTSWAEEVRDCCPLGGKWFCCWKQPPPKTKPGGLQKNPNFARGVWGKGGGGGGGGGGVFLFPFRGLSWEMHLPGMPAGLYRGRKMGGMGNAAKLNLKMGGGVKQSGFRMYGPSGKGVLSSREKFNIGRKEENQLTIMGLEKWLSQGAGLASPKVPKKGEVWKNLKKGLFFLKGIFQIWNRITSKKKKKT